MQVAVARLYDGPDIEGLRDDIASYWHGLSTPATASVVDPDGTTRQLPLTEALPMFRAADCNPIAWHVHLMSFLARDSRTAAPIANITLYPHADGGYQIGGTVGPAHRGQGYGSEALAAVCEIAHHHLGIAQLRAGCETTNLASRRWLASCGFTPTDGPPRHMLPNGRVVDACWWHRSSQATHRCRNRPTTDH